MSDDPRATFEWLSNEYAQALQALTAIENQASTIMAFGGSDDLRTYVDQFLAMAIQTRSVAEEKDEAHFVEWFDELIRKAEALRGELVRD
ncbi:MAG TPA: hypothetical protein VF381_15835 [Thermoanaerobaculia bacterium]